MANSSRAVENFLAWTKHLGELDARTRLWEVLARYPRGVDIQSIVRLVRVPRKRIEKHLQKLEKIDLVYLIRWVTTEKESEKLQNRGIAVHIGIANKRLWCLTEEGRKFFSRAQQAT